MKIARQAVEQSRATLRLQQAARKPDLNFSFGYKRSTGFHALLGGVAVNLPWADRNQGNIVAAYREGGADLLRLLDSERTRDRARRLQELKAASLEQVEHAETELRNVRTAVDNAAIEVARTVRVRIEAPNSDGRLKPEMYASVEIDLGGSEPAPFVAQEAAQEVSGQTVVFVRRAPERFEARAVRLGRTVGGAQEVRTRLPEGLEPTLGPVATAFGEVYQCTLSGSGRSAMELKTLHEWQIKNQLRTIPGVNEVNTWGGETREYHVEADPVRLQRYGLALRDVFERVRENNANFGGGFIEHSAEQHTVRGLGRTRDVTDLESIVVLARAGTPVLLRDVAQVRVGPMPQQGAVLRDGTGETVSGPWPSPYARR